MIGHDGWLPWDIPEDVEYFERMIEGAALIVGRRTYGTMTVVPADTFVVSRQPGLELRPGCRQVNSVEAGIVAGLATGLGLMAEPLIAMSQSVQRQRIAGLTHVDRVELLDRLLEIVLLQEQSRGSHPARAT